MSPKSKKSAFCKIFFSDEIRGGTAPSFELERYHDFNEIEEYVKKVARLNPDFVRLREIGQTFEGRRMLGLKVFQINFVYS